MEPSQEIETAKSQAAQASAWARDFAVASTETATLAGEWLLVAKATAKKLDERRKEITAPLIQAKESADALFKPVIECYLGIEKTLKSKIAEYSARVEGDRRATMQLATAEFAAGGTPTVFAAEPVKVQGVTVTQVWDFEITDPAQVPRELCTPDDKKIKAHMKIQGTSTAIPGVRYFQKDKVTARGARK